MMQDELIGIESQVIFMGESTIDDYKDFWYVYEMCSIEERKENLRESAKAFWTLCTFYKGEMFDSINVSKLVVFIDSLSTSVSNVTSEFYCDKEIVFILFLSSLLHREQMLNPNNKYKFLDFYNKLYDVIDRVKWIFSLEDETGNKIFPIRNLIEDVATTFKLDQEHYLQLVFSLEIFNTVSIDDEDKNRVKQKMLEIAHDYNILLIELLCNGGKVLFDGNASMNSILNGTIIVETNDNVLIRNSSNSYFSVDATVLADYEGEKGYEGKSDSDPIAYYYIYQKKSSETLIDLRTLLAKGTNISRLKAINYSISSGNANVFLGESFWVEQNTKDFIRILNPFGIKDETVITSLGRIADGSTQFEKYLTTISNEYDEFGCCLLAKRGNIDILTVDFVIAYYLELVCEPNNYLELLEESAFIENDFLQNILLKIFFEDAVSNGKIFNAIEKYKLFCRKYYAFNSVNEKTTFKGQNKLILPFAPYSFCDGNFETFCNLLVQNEYIPQTEVKELVIDKSRKTRKKYLVDGNEIPLENIMNIMLSQLDETNIIEGVCLYSKNDNIVYLVNTQNRNINNELKWIQDISESGVINSESVKGFDDIDSILEIICNIGFSKYEDNFGRRIRECIEEATCNIAVYKLLWHIQFWELIDKRYSLFRELILEKYYTEWVKNYKKYMNLYFDDLMKDSNAGKLIIAKESGGERATLKELFEKYNDGSRGPLAKAFDGSQISENCEMKDGVYKYHEKEIQSIVFISDNILSGTSTKAMLDFYLYNKKDEGDKRTYLWAQSELVPSIVKNNPSIKIQLKTILCTAKGKQSIEDDFSEYGLKVTSIIEINDDLYNWTNEVEDMIDLLYETGKRKIWRDDIKCIFRPCNMPAEPIIPGFLKDISLLMGLFQRKEEY